jgi:hypothetical protein
MKNELQFKKHVLEYLFVKIMIFNYGFASEIYKLWISCPITECEQEKGCSKC